VPTQLIVGLCSGVLGGASTAGGPPVVFYALARGWKRDKFRATLMVYFLILAVFAIAMFGARGMITKTVLTYVGVAIVPMFLASRVGIWLKQRTDEQRFRLVILLIVTLTGSIGLGKSSWQLFGKERVAPAIFESESSIVNPDDRSADPVLRNLVPQDPSGRRAAEDPAGADGARGDE